MCLLEESCRFLGGDVVISCAIGYGWFGVEADKFYHHGLSCLGGELGVSDEIPCPMISPTDSRASRLCNWFMCGCVGTPHGIIGGHVVVVVVGG